MPQTEVTTESNCYPETVAQRDQWMNWFYGDDDTKIPCAYYSDADNQNSEKVRENWTNLENALWWVENRSQEGITFVLTEDDPLLVIDGDDVINDDGEIHPVFAHIIDRADSYADVSVSGTGIHIPMRGELPDEIKSIRKTPLQEHPDYPGATIEVYDSDQHVTMSGDKLDSVPNEARSNPELVDDIVEGFAPVVETDGGSGVADYDVSTVSMDEGVSIGEPSESFAECYYALLQAREVATGKTGFVVNTYAGTIGKALGYPTEEIIDDLRNHEPPYDFDEEKTRNHLENLNKEKPPSVSTLRDMGILDGSCSCPLHENTEDLSIDYEPSFGDFDWYGDNTLKSGASYPDGSNPPKTIWPAMADFAPEYSEATLDRVTDALEDLGIARTTEIVDHPRVDRSERQVSKILKELHEENIIEYTSPEPLSNRYGFNHVGREFVSEDRADELGIDRDQLNSALQIRD